MLIYPNDNGWYWIAYTVDGADIVRFALFTEENLSPAPVLANAFSQNVPVHKDGVTQNNYFITSNITGLGDLTLFPVSFRDVEGVLVPSIPGEARTLVARPKSPQWVADPTPAP